MISEENNENSSFVNLTLAESRKYPTTIHYGYELLKGCRIFHDVGKLEEIIQNVGRKISKKEKYSREEAINILKTTHKEIKNLGFKYIENEFDCKSYSLIALAVGEKFNLPLYGVYAPKHIFIRYDSNEKCKEFKESEQFKKPEGELKKSRGLKKLINFIFPLNKTPKKSEEEIFEKEVFNWEATIGEVREDKYYKDFHNFPEKLINNGTFLKNLTKQELIAFFYRQRGIYKLEKENFDLAIEDFNKAIELDSLNCAAYLTRASVYSKRKNYDLAIEDFNKAIELNPLIEDVYNNRGNIYFAKENFDLAIEDFNKAIELNPLEPIIYYNRGLAYGHKKMHLFALKDFNRVLELDPSNVDAQYNRGIAYFENENFELAIKDFNKTIELNPLNYTAYHLRGFSYLLKRKFFDALDDFNKVLEINPLHKEALVYKILIEKRLKEERVESISIFEDYTNPYFKINKFEKDYSYFECEKSGLKNSGLEKYLY